MFKFFYRITPAANDTVQIAMTGRSKLKLTLLSLAPSVLMFAGAAAVAEVEKRKTNQNKKDSAHTS